jgi:hypothetical protein
VSAKGTRKPESTNPSQILNGFDLDSRCSVFGSSKGGRAGGQKDLVWSIERSDSTNNDDSIIVANDACRQR